MLGAVGESQRQVAHPLASQALTGQPVMHMVKLDLGFSWFKQREIPVDLVEALKVL